MKYINSNIEVNKSTGLQESFFKISDQNVSHIFHVLRNQLYSDKEGAVIREYVSNAVDAHKEIGTERPVEITLPTSIESSYCIRDYGRGLTEEEIRDVYVSYGDSTKRNTNKQLGMLGLGAKSAFGYTDNFTIISWNNGKKDIYNAYIDETNCGKIALLSSIPSKEESGIEIKIPVQPHHQDVFKRKTYSICEYFEPQPKILNGSEFPKKEIFLDFEVEKDIYFYLEKTSSYRPSNFTIVMGGVKYIVPYSTLISKTRDSDTTSLLQTRTFNYYEPVLKVKIGDVEVSASRESLELTDKTNNALLQYLKIIKEKITKKSIEKILDASTYSEACINYRGLIKDVVLPKDIFFHGWELTPNHLQERLLEKKYSCRIIEYYSYSNTLNVYGNYCSDVEKNCIFISHGRKPYQERIKHYLKDQIENSYHFFIYLDKDKDINKFIRENHLNDYKLVFINDIIIPSEKKKKVRKRKVSPNILISNGSTWDTPDDIPEETKYFVYIHRSKIYLDSELSEEIKIYNLSNIKFLLKHFLNLDIDEVYGAKKVFKKFDSSWVCLKEKIEELKANSSFQEQCEKSNYHYEIKKYIENLIELKNKITNKEFLSFVNFGEQFLVPKEVSLSYFSKYSYCYSSNVNIQEKFNNLRAEFFEKRTELLNKYPIIGNCIGDKYLTTIEKEDLVKIINLLGDK